MICPNKKSKEWKKLLIDLENEGVNKDFITGYAHVLWNKYDGEITPELIKKDLIEESKPEFGFSAKQHATNTEKKVAMSLLKAIAGNINIEKGGGSKTVLFSAVKGSQSSARTGEVEKVPSYKGITSDKGVIVINTNSFKSAGTMLENSHILLEAYKQGNKDSYKAVKKAIMQSRGTDFKEFYKAETGKGKIDLSDENAIDNTLIKMLNAKGSSIYKNNTDLSKALLQLKQNLDIELQGSLKKLGLKGAETITTDISIGKLTDELKRQNGDAAFKLQSKSWRNLEKRLTIENSEKTKFQEKGVEIYFESREDALRASFSFPNSVIDIAERKLDKNNTVHVLRLFKPDGEITEPTHEILDYNETMRYNSDTGKMEKKDYDGNKLSEKSYDSADKMVSSVTKIFNKRGVHSDLSFGVSRLLRKGYYKPEDLDVNFKHKFADEDSYNSFHKQLKDFFENYNGKGFRRIENGNISFVDNINNISGRSDLIVSDIGKDGLPVRKLIKFEVVNDSDIKDGKILGYETAISEMKPPFDKVRDSRANRNELELGVQAHILTNAGQTINEIQVIPVSLSLDSEGKLTNAMLHNPVEVAHDSRTQENVETLLNKNKEVEKVASSYDVSKIKAFKTQPAAEFELMKKSIGTILTHFGKSDPREITSKDVNEVLGSHGNDVEGSLKGGGVKFNNEQIASLSIADMLHHVGTNDNIDRDSYITNKEKELAKDKNTKAIPEIDKDGNLLLDSKIVSSAEYANQYVRDSKKIDGILEKLENDLKSDSKYKGMSNLEVVQKFLEDKDAVSKVSSQLFELNPEAKSYLVDTLNKASFVQRIFDRFVEESKDDTNPDRGATLLIGQALENGGMNVADFKKTAGFFARYFLTDRNMNINKMPVLVLGHELEQARIKTTKTAYDIHERLKSLDDKIKRTDDGNIKNIEAFVENHDGIMKFKRLENIDAEKFPAEYEFVKYYNELHEKFDLNHNSEDKLTVPVVMNQKKINQVAGGLLGEKRYDHVNIEIEKTKADGTTYKKVERLGNLKEDILSNVAWEDLKSGKAEKELSDLKKWDDLAKAVYKNKGYDFAGRDVAFSTKGTRSANVRKIQSELVHRDFMPNVQRHLVELVLKHDMESVIPMANYVKSLSDEKGELNKYISHVIDHDIVGMNTDTMPDWFKSAANVLINFKYYKSLVLNPYSVMKHATARTLGNFQNHIELMAKTTLLGFPQLLNGNLFKTYKLLKTMDLGVGRLLEKTIPLSDVSVKDFNSVYKKGVKEWGGKLVEAGHFGYSVVDKFNQSMLFAGILTEIRGERGLVGMNKIINNLNLAYKNGEPILNKDGSVKYPEFVLKQDELAMIKSSIQEVHGNYSQNRPAYSHYIVGRLLGQFTAPWAVPMILNTFGSRTVDFHLVEHVGYLPRTANVIGRLSRGEKFSSLSYVDKKKVLATGMSFALTIASGLLWNMYKKDDKKLMEGTKEEYLSENELNEHQHNKTMMSFMSLAYGEATIMYPELGNLVDSKGGNKIGTAFSVVTDGKAVNALSTITLASEFTSHLWSAAHLGNLLKESPNARVTKASADYSLGDYKFVDDLEWKLLTPSMAQEIHKWAREGGSVPFVGDLFKNDVIIDKKLARFITQLRTNVGSRITNQYLNDMEVDPRSSDGEKEYQKLWDEHKAEIDSIVNATVATMIQQYKGSDISKSDYFKAIMEQSRRTEQENKKRQKFIESLLMQDDGFFGAIEDARKVFEENAKREREENKNLKEENQSFQEK